jgi:hypothetical protein
MKILPVLIVACATGFPSPVDASILAIKEFDIDFTNPIDAPTKATWSKPDRLTISKDGLGWEGGDPNAYWESWIKTEPVALGVSWRTPSAISVQLTIRPLPSELTLNSGQKYTPDIGSAYVRYSPDLTHWSTWQVLQRVEPQSIRENALPGRIFGGKIQVPSRNRERYQELLQEYARRDVPWESDEEAAVDWILESDPQFFAKQIPFIGYAEFLFESGIRSGQRIRSLKAEISYGMSGMHTLPKEPRFQLGRDVPWRFTSRMN